LIISRKDRRKIMDFKLDESECHLRDEIKKNLDSVKRLLGQNCINEIEQGQIEMGKNAHELHILLMKKDHKPQHKDYMIKNRGVEPEDPLFYMNIHPVEDLLEYIKNLENPHVTLHELSSHCGMNPVLFGVITLLDILGWKGVYSRKEDPISSLMRLTNDIISQSETHRGKVNGNTEVISISDTIAIYTPCSENEVSEAIDIHRALCQWIIPKSIGEGIPVRGAISYGEIKVKKNTFVGRAVDEAASWYEQADWIGVHLTPSAEFITDIKDDREKWIKFLPKCKTPLDRKLYCVNWTANWKDKQQETEDIKKKFCNLGPITPEIVSKLANTLKFIEEINGLT
jgi:hypothetical protein